VSLGKTAEGLKRLGVETLAIVATEARRARLYFGAHPTRCGIGADPDLVTHRAYGVPRTALTPDIWNAVESAARQLARELRLPVAEGGAYGAIDRLDAFLKSEGDTADLERHQGQLAAQFLVDRDGIVRWANIECDRDGLAGIDRFPSEKEILEAARALA
jgi:hypothetical protein